MLKKIGFMVVGLSMVASPFIASADTYSDIQAKIQSLLAQIATLQQQIAALNISSNPVACTQEARQCPDGSYVGRSGPNCEFTACGRSGSTMPSRVCPQILRSLSRGSTGNDVMGLQTYLGVSPTGYFGPMTESAVVQFQGGEGLSQVGIVGPQTRAAFARRCVPGQGGNSISNTIDNQGTSITPVSGLGTVSGTVGGGSTNDSTTGSANIVQISATPTSGNAPLSVTFSAIGTTGSEYVIEYGDGAHSEGLFPLACQNIYGCPMSATHTYTTAGTYTAILSPYIPCLYSNSSPLCMVPMQGLGTVTITAR